MATAQEFGSWRHLATRFFEALSPAGPSHADEAWALGALLEGERALWEQMSGPDRRHAVGVARSTIQLLRPDEPRREVIAAALLHDVGKIDASLGATARAAVTLAAIAFGRERLIAWAGSSPKVARRSARARAGIYLAHDSVGAKLLESAGSHPLTVSWAGEHHLPPGRWTVGSKVGAALKASDGD